MSSRRLLVLLVLGLLVIAGATQPELARQIKYLKVENELLRKRLPESIYRLGKLR